MRAVPALVLLATATSATAGDEFQLPVLRPGSSYDSADPPYQMVGVEERDGLCRAWVVADADSALHQRSVNRIIARIYARASPTQSCPNLLGVNFYSSVRSEPTFPAFRITDELGSYDWAANKTYFLGTEKTYGGWAYGPVRASALRSNYRLERP